MAAPIDKSNFSRTLDLGLTSLLTGQICFLKHKTGRPQRHLIGSSGRKSCSRAWNSELRNWCLFDSYDS